MLVFISEMTTQGSFYWLPGIHAE